MAFCGKCGTQVGDNVKFCPGCGAPISVAAAADAGTAGAGAGAYAPNDGTSEQAYEQPRARRDDFTSRVEKLNDTADTTGSYAQKDVADNKVMAILAYFGPLVLVPILAAKESPFARFHANQGLVLLIADIAYGIIEGILLAIFWAISWQLGSIMSTVLGLVWILFAVVAIIGIINAANGKAKELPIIGKITILK